jgi:hypothetical protein
MVQLNSKMTAKKLPSSVRLWVNFQDLDLERQYQEFAKKQLRRTFDTIRCIIFLTYQCIMIYIGVFKRCPVAAVSPLGALAMDIILLLCLKLLGHEGQFPDQPAFRYEPVTHSNTWAYRT